MQSIRNQIDCEEVFSALALNYKMHLQLRIGNTALHQELEIRRSSKTAANLMEAYIGAIAMQYDAEEAIHFVQKLLRPFSQNLYEYHAAAMEISQKIPSTRAGMPNIILET